MLPLLIFTVLLALAAFFVEPNHLLCSTSLSPGILSGQPHLLYAFSLVPLFASLRARYAGFLLLAPAIVSAAMTPAGAAVCLIGAGALFARRYVQWIPLVVSAAGLLLALFAGLPIAAIALLALLVPFTGLVPPLGWRVRLIVAWFGLAALAFYLIAEHVRSFPFELFGYDPLPLAPVLVVALAVQAMLLLEKDSNAELFRLTLLLLASFAFPMVSLFAMPLIVGLIGARIEQSREGVTTAFLLAVVIVVIALLPGFDTSDPIDVDRAIVLTPDYFELACDDRAYPDRLTPDTDLPQILQRSQPGSVAQALYERNLTTIVYAETQLPFVEAVERNDAFTIESVDGVSVASLPSADRRR